MRADGLLKMYSLDARGKFGRGGGFGRISFGYNYFGFYSIFSGIYQKKYYYGEPYISKSKFYRPTNPQTLKQQNWRYVNAYGVYLWQNFDSETKIFWNENGRIKKMSGYNAWLSYWLKNPTFGFGLILFGRNIFGYR